MAEKEMLRSQYNQINEELHVLRTTETDNVLDKINEAKSHGDLSENAEYDAAREEQAKLTERIRELESSIEDVVIIEDSDLDKETIHVGSKVEIFDSNMDAGKTIVIVNSINAKPLEGLISETSPIAKAILGHSAGDVVTVELPRGTNSIKILKIYD